MPFGTMMWSMALVLQLAPAAAAAAARPHILMMLADDWGSYDASWRMKELGREPDIHTANIDALSADGIRFANYYVQPICTPTRSVLMSGRYSIHTGCEHILFGASEPSCLPVDLPIMPQAFKQLQYQTHMAGKWHLGYYNDSCSPWTRGFDSYIGYLNGVEGYYSHGMGAYVDFHECVNDTDTGPNMTTTGTGDPTYKHVVGSMPAGHDVVPPRNISYADAVDLCNSLQGKNPGSSADPWPCMGFTFEGADFAPFKPVKMYFKSSLTVNSDPEWQSYIKADIPAPKTCDQCSHRYDGEYSTHVYTKHVQGLLTDWKPADKPIFLYMAWQAVHEPMSVPDSYRVAYNSTIDPSRQIYAGMLTALDEGIGNITDTLKAQGMYDNSVMVLSNDNGGMSGSYGMGCCNCGTSCGGLNYPYRGWKDSFWEGGFRGIGFVHSPLLKQTGISYKPILHVSDWYKTLVSAALSKDSPGDAAAARKTIAHIFEIGPIDSVDQWSALNGQSQRGEPSTSSSPTVQFSAADGPRTEVLLAGIDSDKRGAAIRVGNYKLLIGDWGADTWCDLNRTGFSPVFPAPPTAKPPSEGGGGFGGLVCVTLNGTTGLGNQQLQADGTPKDWTNTTRGLFDVVEDPREMHDLQHEKPDVVAALMARFLAHNLTTVSSIHLPRDPAGTAHANATDCWSPWEGK